MMKKMFDVMTLKGLSRGLVCLAALSACSVHAEEDVIPLYLTLSQVIEHDDNLLKDNSRKAGDRVLSTRAKVGLDKAYGRQHYRLDATLAKNKYKNFDRFDNDSLVSSGSFTTDIASDFRFTANANAARELPKFEDSVANRQAANERRNSSLSVDLRYGLYGRMSVNGGLSKSRLRYDVTDGDNRDSNSAYVGLRYLPNDVMYYGLTYTRTSSEFPLRDVWYQIGDSIGFDTRIGEEVDRDSLGFNAYWQVTGFSVFSGSLAYSKEQHKYDRRRDFSGVTGGASWKFTPAGKLAYSLSWSRDTNNSGGFTSFTPLSSSSSQGVAGFNAFDRVTNTYSANVSYDMTSKLAFSLAYSYITYGEESTTSVSNSLSVSNVSSKGRYQGYSLGGTYRPLDALGLGCDVQFYDRTRSQFSVAFDGRSVSCYASFTLQ